MNAEKKADLFPIALNAVILDCPDRYELAEFYLRLLGWEKTYDDDEWIDIAPPSGSIKISFQDNPGYVRPVWPDEPGKQQQMAHLDFTVKDTQQLELAVAHAIECGAIKAPVQYGGDQWATLFDPAGHPFCFVIW